MFAKWDRKLFETNVTISCRQCKLEMKGDGCDLAIIDAGKNYRVDGVEIDAHGDAHSKDGFCNCVRETVVTEIVKDDRVTISEVSIISVEKKEKPDK